MNKEFYRIIIFCVILFYISGCTPKENNYFLKIENNFGLNLDSKIYSNDKEIGKIVNICLDKNGNVIIEMKIFKNKKISKNSRFSIRNVNLFDKGIFIENGNNQPFYNINDTINRIKKSKFLIKKLREKKLNSVVNNKLKDIWDK